MSRNQKKYVDANGAKDLFRSFLDILGITTSTVQEALDLKANIASPVLTGVPTAPTAAYGTSTDQIATTAFVQAAMCASILVTVTPAMANVTVTATLSTDNIVTASGTTNAAGLAIIALPRFGVYNISYSDTRAKGETVVEILDANQRLLEVSWNELIVYTIQIDESNSNVKTACTYLDDAVSMTAGSDNWDTQPIFNTIRPCVFQNGSVNYYLNPNNFNQKVDGTPSVLTGEDGDVMIKFDKFGYKIWRDAENANLLNVSITNDFTYAENNNYCFDAFSRESEGDLTRMFVGAFKGYIDGDGKLRSIVGVHPSHTKNIATFRAAAQLNGAHYQQTMYSHLKALQCLYLIKYGTRNGQEAVGKGYCSQADNSSYSVTIKTGSSTTDLVGVNDANATGTSTLDKGMNWGNKIAGYDHVKLFGIEDFWGNIWEWVDGLWTDSTRDATTGGTVANTSWNTFVNGNTGEDVTSSVTKTVTTSTANESGWIKSVQGNNDLGFLYKTNGGSSSTFWADDGGLFSGYVAFFGGRWNYGDICGPFYLSVTNGTGSANRIIGARLHYN